MGTTTKKNVNNTTTTTKVATNAKGDVKALTIFYYIKELKNLGKKNAYCEHTNIAELGRRVKSVHGGNGHFIVDVFTRDYMGRYCTTSAAKETGTMLESEYDGMSFRTFVDAKGRELVDGMLLTPITLSLGGVIDAYKKVVNAKESQEREAKRAAEREAREEKKAKRERENAAKMFDVVEKVFGELAVTFSPDEIAEKYAKIKAA